MQLAPWLQPPDYLRAIDSGAQLGLGVRRADLEQAQMAQRAAQAAAELRQSWAAKMLENQRMTEQSRLTAASNDLYRSEMLDARNRGLDIRETQVNKPPAERPLPTLSPGEAYFNPQTQKWETPNPKPPTKETPERTDPFALSTFNHNLGEISRIKLGVAGGNIPEDQGKSLISDLQKQNDSLRVKPASSSLATTNMPTVMPSLPNAGNPAGGTNGLPSIEEARAFANTLIANKRDPNGVRARFKAVYGQDL
jgi:hypothetical protein